MGSFRNRKGSMEEECIDEGLGPPEGIQSQRINKVTQDKGRGRHTFTEDKE